MRIHHLFVSILLVGVLVVPDHADAGAAALEAWMAADYCAQPALSEADRAAYEAQLEDRVGTPALERARLVLLLAGDVIAQARTDERACRKAFKRGEARFTKMLKKQTRRVKRGTARISGGDPAIRAVRQRLQEAFIADQAARVTYLELATDDRTGPDFWARRLAMATAIARDAVGIELMQELLADYDWIDARRFGARTSTHAWVLVQHADAQPDFQREALTRMEPYLASGGVKKRDFAYLFDRVAVNTGQPQRYGTQPRETCNADGTLSPKTLEDPAQVDQQRAAMGMEPMADAMAEMAAWRCR